MEITTFLPVRWKAERTDFTFLVPNALIPEVLVPEFSVLHSERSRVPRRRLHGSSESQADALFPSELVMRLPGGRRKPSARAAAALLSSTVPALTENALLLSLAWRRFVFLQRCGY